MSSLFNYHRKPAGNGNAMRKHSRHSLRLSALFHSRHSTGDSEVLCDSPASAGTNIVFCEVQSNAPLPILHSSPQNDRAFSNTDTESTDPLPATEGEDCVVADAMNAVSSVMSHHPRLNTGSLSLDIAATALKVGQDVGNTLSSSQNTNTHHNEVVQKVHDIFDHIPVFVKLLEEVAKIHPFIHVGVLTFKAFYVLEMKRRSNEEKVVAVLVEVRDMLDVLVHLKKVDPGTLDGEGVTIEARMKILLGATAKEIKQCANVCDAYSKTKTVVKVVKGPLWEGTFINYVKLFAKRRDEFKFMLSTYIAVKVNEIDQKMDNLTRSVAEKTDVIINLLQNFIPAEQQAMRDKVEQKGGASAVLHDEAVLHELITTEAQSGPAGNNPKQAAGRIRDSIEEVKRQLDDPVVVIERNLQSFERKFEMQQRQIMEEMEKVIHRESDRVIESVRSGPHDKIVDKDLHAIWQDMGWRGNAKARNLVLAIRDFYHERAEDKHRADSPHESPQDSWALPWIAVKRLQPIVEAFDDDASGYVTIAKVNNFTKSRPVDWSLLRWLAFWAVGWQSSVTAYRDKIHEQFSAMFALKTSVHTANRRIVERYLDQVWQPIILLTSSFQSYTTTGKMHSRFKDYIEAEETRVKRNLEATRYHIDDLTTLSLVTGPGRIEQYLFQLIYLIIKRDLDVMQLCRTRVISERELEDSIRSLWLVMAAVDDRHKELEETFRHQNLDPGQQFKITYCKLFDHYHNPSSLFSRKGLGDIGHSKNSHHNITDVPGIDAGTVLNHSHQDTDEWEVSLDRAAYDMDDVPHVDCTEASESLKPALGTWRCHMYTTDDHLIAPMFLLSIRVSPTDLGKFAASGVIPGSSMFANFKLEGAYELQEGGRPGYSFVMECSAPFESKRFNGCVSDDGMTFSGTWGSSWKVVGRFVFSRLPPEIMRYRPSPIDLQRNRTKALWRFVLTATMGEVVRKKWSWDFFRQRRDFRRRYLDLLFRTSSGRPLDADEEQELLDIKRVLTPSDARFYQSLCDMRHQTACHHGVTCDSCGGIISGARVVCLDCDTHEKSFSTIDLCEDQRCMAAQVGLDRRSDLPTPHLPSHNVLKTRTMIHLRDFGKVERQALAALQRATASSAEVEEQKHELITHRLAGDRGQTRNINSGEQVCTACKGALIRPCWYCIECEKQATDKEESLEHRLDFWESKLIVMDSRIDEQGSEMNSRLVQLEMRLSKVDNRLAQVDERLVHMERLLEAVASRLD
ncbi:predicted protein [Postia placenta Mad-698-R]|uniref:Uncharacterized protein n=1 Tax=Postia placenta MAD-698-R-SB12 TaxID=670580 RepID=A0A1X6MS29_9APHY|nr:hypothetical protein POSPLADRAFT_1151825 [Postia placenta MAD-698-R-SB12]EED80010.1 predicted protein [Postia placenta Mad-698-R]OSX58993.1 hypothetical protein POSPLADRAFT_1151825 [Postia placenta MAD-698-R-SB12]